jgi:hypothetical protein
MLKKFVHVEEDIVDGVECVDNVEFAKVSQEFKDSVKSELPLIVCTDCGEMCFNAEIGLVDKDNYTCVRCVRARENGQIPLLSIENGCSLPAAFPGLPCLTEIESKIVALQIPYMNVVQLFAWKGGYQVAMRGNVINIPNNVCDVVNTLPRLPDEMMDATLFVSLYKNAKSGFSFWSDNVRPAVVHSYLSQLCTTPLYMEQNIRYDHNRNLTAMKDIDVHVCDANDIDQEHVTVEDEEVQIECSGTFYDPYGSKLSSDFVLNEYWSADKVQRLSTVHMKIEPCVNQAFVGMLRDHNSAEKCFPNIFLGQIYFQKERNENVAVDKLHKHLLRLYVLERRFYTIQTGSNCRHLLVRVS